MRFFWRKKSLHFFIVSLEIVDNPLIIFMINKLSEDSKFNELLYKSYPDFSFGSERGLFVNFFICLSSPILEHLSCFDLPSGMKLYDLLMP